MARLQDIYKTEVVSALQKELSIDNPMAVPRLQKIVISMGIGEGKTDKGMIETGVEQLGLIAGQKPVVMKAKKSVSNFKLRAGMPVGVKVTLRREQMYEFLDRLISVVIPRVRDFRGLKPSGFDGHGNFNMGLSEQSIFPEIDPDKISFTQGMNLAFQTTATKDEDAKALLTVLGMPFRTN